MAVAPSPSRDFKWCGNRIRLTAAEKQHLDAIPGFTVDELLEGDETHEPACCLERGHDGRHHSEVGYINGRIGGHEAPDDLVGFWWIAWNVGRPESRSIDHQEHCDKENGGWYCGLPVDHPGGCNFSVQ